MQTSSCISFNAADFSSLMSERSDRFSINLTHSNLIEVIKAYIKQKSITRPKFSKQWGTTLKYLNGLQFLCGQIIYPDKISELFYPHLIQYMLQQGCATTTVERTISQIRASLEWGSRYGAPISPTYDKSDFKGQTKEKTILSYTELCHVYFFDIRTLKKPNGKAYRKDWYAITERVRDMFIFSTLFGQRYSDSIRISPECFNDDKFCITQQKTGNRVNFRYMDYVFDQRIARQLLHKYDYTAPYRHDINNYIKRLKELLRGIGCEFLQDVVTEEKVQGEIVRTIIPRWEAVASHTARRSAISFWANKGKSPQWIRKMSGHADLRSMERYMLDEED